MTDPNVERKKSYRWASASKVSYDGAGWDSSDDENDVNSPIEAMVSQTHALPSLPKLDYSNNIDAHQEEIFPETRDEPLVGVNLSVSPQIIMTPDPNQYLSGDAHIDNINNSSQSDGSNNVSNMEVNNNHSETSILLRKSSPSRDINVDLDNLMEQISKEMTPKLASSGVFEDTNITSDSINDQFLSARASQSPYVSQDNFAAMSNSTPNITQQSSPNEIEHHEFNSYSDRVVESGSNSDSDDHSMDDSMHVSQGGYFQEYLHSNENQSEEEHDYTINAYISDSTRSENNEDTLSFTNSIQYDDHDHEERVNDHEVTNNDYEIMDDDKNGDSISISDLKNNESVSQEHFEDENEEDNENDSEDDFKFKVKQARESIIESSDDDGESDDGIIYANPSNSIVDQSDSKENLHSDHTKTVETEDQADDVVIGDDDTDDESMLRVSKSGYFGKMIQPPSFDDNLLEKGSEPEIHYYREQSVETNLHNENGSDENTSEDILSLPASIEDETPLELEYSTKEQNIIEEQGKQIETDQEEDEDKDEDKTSILEDTLDDNTSLAVSNSEKLVGREAFVGSLEFENKHEEEEHKEKQENSNNDEDSDDDRADVVTTASWQPDTDSSRSGFVQETAKKASPPPGFVFDENGKLVDLTPSSMKPRVVSTYSEIESGWNMFPTNRTNDNDDSNDLETIRDTKTIYDNSTIYNVPGLITNNENLPPLPSNIDTTDVTVSNNSSESTSNYQTPVGTLVTPTTAQTGKSLPTSTYSVGLTPPNSKEFSRINLNNSMPELNVGKLITTKGNHADKLQQLNSYYNDLVDYDTGLQSWVLYSLKSMPGDENSAIHDYKQSKIVKDAYANAEEFSKKHTVSNTVASVNQNVNHLKKKVLLHTIKPKTLFSSIGKGVKL